MIDFTLFEKIIDILNSARIKDPGITPVQRARLILDDPVFFGAFPAGSNALALLQEIAAGREVDLDQTDDLSPEIEKILSRIIFTPLQCGTSGIRGKIRYMTDLECYINERAKCRYFRSFHRRETDSDCQCISGDLRPSSPRIMAAVAQAMLDEQYRPVLCGFIPSPALMYYAVKNGRASTMVTGSHVPADRNGMKFNSTTGEILKSDEQAMQDYIVQVRREEYARLGTPGSPFDKTTDMFIESRVPLLEKIADESEKAAEAYIARYTRVFPSQCLQGLKLVHYQHSSVGRDLQLQILERLGAEVIRVGRCQEGEFMAVDTEEVSPERQRAVDRWLQRYQADAVVFHDGDSDRPGVFLRRESGRLSRISRILPLPRFLRRDVQGEFIWGDNLGILVSEFLKVTAAAVTISSNDSIDLALNKAGIKLVKTRIGSPYVVAAMQAATAAGEKTVASWEGNGGYLLNSPVEIFGQILEPLPTRDAVLPIICLLASARQQNKSLAELVDTLPRRFKFAGRIKNFPLQISRAVIKHYSPADDQILEVIFNQEKRKLKVIFLPADAVSRDPGPTESFSYDDPRSQELLEIKNRLEQDHITSERKFQGGVKRINYLDGIRISCGNSDVIHLRPSGNAPECRCYANADTSQRARQIVALGLEQIIPAMQVEIELI